MAEAVVSVLLERLAEIAFDKMKEEFKLITGVEKEVECVTRNLEAIRAVLEDADQRQVTEAAVRLWLSELTEVSFDMDDLLDEWITAVQKRQMERQEERGKSILSVATTKKKVRFPCLSSCFCFGQASQLRLRREIAGRIKKLNESIASIDKAKQQFTFQNTVRVPELPQQPITTSLPDVKTFGRDDEKNLLVTKLLSESSEGNEVPLIIPIVGMGGMGKTTLAQLVYNDENVKSHFDKRVWVCVSQSFEEIKIAQAIVEGLDRDNTSKNSNQLQILVQCICELLQSKKFLLVLDNVWSYEPTQWKELIKSLRYGAMGSRVLVTTRNEEIVVLMEATTQMISLKNLGEAFCLSLFYYSAGMAENSVSEEFHTIGLELVKRCNGLPLAAKTLGSHMRDKKTIHKWQEVLKSKTWEMEKIQQNVFRPLLLSYHDLPLTTKCRLLYCVIFPKNYVYNKNQLIELWMSQDYLNGKDSKEKMTVGRKCFNDLVMRSFFQVVELNDASGNTTCKIHDIVHDFLQYLTENERLILDFALDASERKEVVTNKVHHLNVVNASDSESLVHIPSYKKLRTLVIDSSLNSIGMILQLKCPRTLILRVRADWKRETLEFPMYEIPESIGRLIHLRYLDLSGNEQLVELPESMSSLYNLQTLRLVRCRGLKRLAVGRLINLRHLYVEYCDSLYLIKGLEKSTNMQTLDCFSVLGGDGKKLEDLKDLNQLQGSLKIQISGDHHSATMAENAAILVDKAHLLELKLEFYYEGEQREILNRLEPHPSLVSLNIFRYAGGALSNWLSSLHSLTVLTLEFCQECKILPPLGKLASLESLHLKHFEGVTKVGLEFLGREYQTSSSSAFVSFPKLKQLSIDHMSSWEEWEGVEEEDSKNITIMPCLSQLTIDFCNKLKQLPDFLWKTPLQILQISDSQILQSLDREEMHHKISHIPSIQFRVIEIESHCCIC